LRRDPDLLPKAKTNSVEQKQQQTARGYKRADRNITVNEETWEVKAGKKMKLLGEKVRRS